MNAFNKVIIGLFLLTSACAPEDGANGRNGLNGVNGPAGIDGINAPLLVYICHIPNGKVSKRHVMYAPEETVLAHEMHGDYVGECL